MEGEGSSSRACAPPHRLSPEEVKRLLKICHGGLTTAQILENMSGEFRMESASDDREVIMMKYMIEQQ